MKYCKSAILLLIFSILLKAQPFNNVFESSQDAIHDNIVDFQSNEISSLIEYYDEYVSNGSWENLISLSNNIGVNIFFRQDFENIFYYFLRGLEKGTESLGGTHYEAIKGHNILGWAHFVRGYFQNAIYFWNRGIDLIELSPEKNELLKCYFYSNIALAYNQRGDNGLANKYYDRALPILKKNYYDLESFEEKIICGIYLSHNLNVKSEFDNSLQILHNIKDMLLKEAGDNKYLISTVLYLIGHTHGSMGNLKESLQSFNESIKYLKSNSIEESYLSFLLYRSLADGSYKQKNYSFAAKFMEFAINASKVLLGDFHVETLHCYKMIGQIYEKQNNYIEALKYYEKSITGNLNRAEHSGNSLIPDDYFIDPLFNKAKLLTDIYNNDSKKVNDLIEAFESYKVASELVEKIRRSYIAQESKLNLSEKASRLYKGAVKTSLKLFNITQDEKYKNDAFIFAEKNKAGILNESLTEAFAKTFGNIPDSLLDKEKNIRTRLAYFETEIDKEIQKGIKKDSLKIVNYQREFFYINLEYQNLINSFEKNYPSYFDLKYKTNSLSVKKIQKDILDRNTTLLEYFVADTTLFIFLIDNSSCEIFTTSLIDDSVIDKFNNSIYNIDTEEYIASGYYLYKKLIEPVKEKIKSKVIIIPDGNIHNIPFDALLTEQLEFKPELNFSILPFLIKEIELSYSYSASMKYNSIRNYRTRSYSNDFVGFAPVFAENHELNVPRYLASSLGYENSDGEIVPSRSVINKNGNFKWLPSSEQELISIHDMFIENDLTAKIFLNSDASEVKVKKELSNNYKYLHFATHAFINYKNINLSGIALNRDFTNNEDGILYINEIYNLNLNADLAVLSACESGLGSYAKGEGIIGLTRGFIYSGVNNLVVTLWEVLDKSTPDLMVKFYSNILDGKSYTHSLRKSKLEFIESDVYSAPFFWAPFVLVGN